MPEAFLEQLLAKLNEQIDYGEVIISNRYSSSLSSLRKGIQHFIIKNKQEYSSFYSEYMHKDFPSLSILQRAFNRKKPYGATERTVNLLALYLSDGKNDWIDLQKEKFETGAKKKKNMQAIVGTKKDTLQQFLKKFPRLSEGRIEGGILPIFSDNNPLMPEFPPPPFYKPSFPATPIVKLKINGWDNVWLKDESHNPTGTHKDRMAWEVTIQAVRNHWKEMSLISSGGAASAIQHVFNLFGVATKLKVLMDKHTDKAIIHSLEKMGCKVYLHDLRNKMLLSSEIKMLTENQEGVDVTYRSTLDGNNMIYYDWLSYEILNFEPEYCIVPFGTGDLFINLLNIVEKEVDTDSLKLQNGDPRFGSDINQIKNCHFIGVRATSEETKMDKLYAAYLPTLDHYKQKLKRLTHTGAIGKKSEIHEIRNDDGLLEALSLASHNSIKTEPSGIAGLAWLLSNELSLNYEAKILIVNTGKVRYPSPL